MYQKIHSYWGNGIDAVPLDVEVNTSGGLPYLNILGIPSTKENTIRERCRSAIHTCGFSMPNGRITINLVPSEISSNHTGLDLPIALGILCADRSLPDNRNPRTAVIGDLSLDGEILPITGIISILTAMQAEDENKRPKELLLPAANAAEAAYFPGLRLIPVRSLAEACAFWKGQLEILPVRHKPLTYPRASSEILRSIRGQLPGKRALTVACAGFHNLLLSGPPGCGKTLLARSAPSLMPLPHPDEIERLMKIRSYTHGTISPELTRPVRAPHTSATQRTLFGGQRPPSPGELMLADGGLLILDEIAEFPRRLLDQLRQPLESHQILHEGLRADKLYRADFMTIATMNLCPCGFYPDQERCRCTMHDVRRYQGRLGAPLLERFDMILMLADVAPDETQMYTENDVKMLCEQIDSAVKRQHVRYQNEPFLYNSRVPASLIDTLIPLSEPVTDLLQSAALNLKLSLRTQHNAIKTARTIADLADEDQITVKHMAEALQYRPKGFLVGEV